MSWFSRMWTGEHEEDCPCYDPTGEESELEGECACPELLMDKMISNADNLRKAAKEAL